MNIKFLNKSLSIILALVFIVQSSSLVKAQEISEADRINEEQKQDLIAQIDAANNMLQSGESNDKNEMILPDYHYPEFTYEYSAGFKLGTQLKNNTTIKSFIRFTMDVNLDGDATFDLDGQASERGYVWSDKFTIKVTDKDGKEKYSTTLKDWSSAYSGAFSLIDGLNNAKVSLYDTITITSTYWNDTIGFYPIQNGNIYNPTANAKLAFNDKKTHAYIISNYGLIKQTKDNSVNINRGYTVNATVKVRNTKTNKTSNGILRFGIAQKPPMNDPDLAVFYRFGVNTDLRKEDRVNVVWDDDYMIFVERIETGKIESGVYLTKGEPIGKGLDAIKEIFNNNWDDDLYIYKNAFRLSFRSDNKTIKINQIEWLLPELPALFTNDYDDFSDGTNDRLVSFYMTDVGLMQE